MNIFVKSVVFRPRVKQNKKSHEGIHAGRMFSCNQCEYQAKRKSHLDTHQQSLHMGIKFRCQQCDYQTTNKSTLAVHAKTVQISSM